MWLFSSFEEDITKFFTLDKTAYQTITNKTNLTMNFLEVGLGLCGAFLDFTPTQNHIKTKKDIS